MALLPVQVQYYKGFHNQAICLTSEQPGIVTDSKRKVTFCICSFEFGTDAKMNKKYKQPHTRNIRLEKRNLVQQSGVIYSTSSLITRTSNNKDFSHSKWGYVAAYHPWSSRNSVWVWDPVLLSDPTDRLPSAQTKVLVLSLNLFSLMPYV